MKDLVLTLRAFRWRRGGSIVVLVVAALTVAAAAIGPLYAGAAAESVLQDRLRQGSAADTTIAFSVQADVSYPGSIDLMSAPEAQRGSLPGYGPIVNEASVTSSVTAAGGLASQTDVVWRDGACAHLVITSGTCPTGVGDVLVSGRSAAYEGWKLGTTLELAGLQQYDTNTPGSTIATTPLALRIVGLYHPRSTLDPFWAGRPYFAFHPFQGSGDGPNTIEAMFVSIAVFPTLVHPTMGTISADLLLTDPSAIRVADVPRLRDAVTAYLGSDTTGPQPKTGLLTVLAGFEAERSMTALASAVVSAQLALLALLLLALVITDTSEARGGEVALAKVRGLPPRAVAAVALREPVLLLLLAIPVGLVLAYVGAVLLARALFFPGVPVAVTPATWAAVGIAFLGGLVAALLASRRLLTRPVLDQWSASDPSSSPRSGIVVDIVLAVVALAGFLVLHNMDQGTTDGSTAVRALGWAAPGLLAIAVALLLVRFAQPLLSRFVPVTRASHRIGLFLAVRQVVRRPAGLRLAALLAVTIALATFAVDAQAAAEQGRVVRAGADVGAATSVAVQPGGGGAAGPVTSVAVQPGGSVDVQRAVDEADPDGRWAMAVADWIPYGGAVDGRMLGVQSSRLAAVALWSPDYGAGTAEHVAALISPPLPPRLPLTQATVRVRITSGPVPTPAPTVLIGLRDPAGRPVTAVSTPLQAGTHDYDASTGCPAAQCAFLGVALNRALDGGTAHLDVLVTAVAQGTGTTFTPVPAPLHRADLWRISAFSGDPVGSLSASAAGLRYVAAVPANASPFIQYADSPLPLPMITTPSSFAPPATGPPSVNDVYGQAIPVAPVGTATVLPVVGDTGVMVDLTALTRATGPLDDADWSVWLGADAPPDAVQRLTRAGIVVDAVTTAAQRQAQLDREGPALALRLLLFCALIGAVLAASAVAISVAVTGRRRSYELAALRAVAVRRSALVRACVLEQLLLLGIGLVIGVPTGLAVARLALPTLPQSSSPTALPLTLDVQTLAVTTFVIVTALLLVTTAVVAGLMLVRQAVPDRLREVAP